jgi:hypothetical protein
VKVHLAKSNLMKLDTDIYNVLLDAKKGGHNLLKHFKIYYPEKINISMTNAIYVGRLETNLVENEYVTFDMTQWNVNIEIVITTKDNPKLERRKLLKSASVAVKNVLHNSGLDLQVKAINFEYDNTNVIQQCRMVIEGTEYDLYEDDKEYLHICNILDKIDVI